MTYKPCTTPTDGPCPRMREYQAELARRDPGGRSLGIYNRRKIAGSQTWSLHACGRAIDWQPSTKGAGDAIAAWLSGPQGPSDCQMFIWYRRKWYPHNPGDGYSPYHGQDPHTGHLHIESCECSGENPAR